MNLQLTMDEVIASPASASAAGVGVRLLPFAPQRFGDIVLCVGPSNALWPSDQSLLDSLVQSAREAVVEGVRHQGRRMPAFALSVIGVLTAASLFVGYSVQPAEARSPQEPLAVRVARIVSTLSEAAVKVREEGGRVVVEGLVPTQADVSALRHALAELPPESIDHRYAAVVQISQSIAEAMRLPDAKVIYRGDGVFRLEASAVHPEQVKREAERVAADLGPLVKRIEPVIAILPAPERVPVAAVLSSDAVKYVQTRDGAKYLELSSEPMGAPLASIALRDSRQSNFSFLE